MKSLFWILFTLSTAPTFAAGNEFSNLLRQFAQANDAKVTAITCLDSHGRPSWKGSLLAASDSAVTVSLVGSLAGRKAEYRITRNWPKYSYRELVTYSTRKNIVFEQTGLLYSDRDSSQVIKRVHKNLDENGITTGGGIGDNGDGTFNLTFQEVGFYKDRNGSCSTYNSSVSGCTYSDVADVSSFNFKKDKWIKIDKCFIDYDVHTLGN